MLSAYALGSSSPFLDLSLGVSPFASDRYPAMVEQSRHTLRLFDRAKGLCCLLPLLLLALLSAPLAAAPLPGEQGDTDQLSQLIPELRLAPLEPVEEYQPQELRLAQMEDPELILELQGEETLAELQENEFEEEEWF